MRAERRIDHGELLPTTAIVIGHGGHATAARALSYGIPLLLMPMHPLMDQPVVARAVERVGAGRVLPRTAKPERIRETVRALLADSSVRSAAQDLGRSVRERDGAVVAADLLEHHAATATVS